MRIMIVDDSLSMRLMISYLAQDLYPDGQIELFDCAEAALTAVEQQIFDYYSLDYTLPGMNGIDLAHKIKALDSKAKIILVTANKQKAIQDRAEELGIAMIVKPEIDDPLTRFFQGEDL